MVMMLLCQALRLLETSTGPYDGDDCSLQAWGLGQGGTLTIAHSDVCVFQNIAVAIIKDNNGCALVLVLDLMDYLCKGCSF